jgi:hypothetical protein
MRRGILVCVIAIAVVAATAATASAKAIRTDVKSIHLTREGANKTLITGTLVSPNFRCVAGRKLAFTASMPRPDDVDRTSHLGAFAGIIFEKKTKSMTFGIQGDKKKLANGRTCGAVNYVHVCQQGSRSERRVRRGGDDRAARPRACG